MCFLRISWIAFAWPLALFLFASTMQTQAEERKVRVGWQIPWATQGQIVQALKHTNILNEVNLTAEFVGFSYGGPLNRAALAGEVDILLTADQPATVLLSKGKGFKIVSRMMYNRVCLYVPPASGVSELTDLSGGVIMGPIGAAAERVAMSTLAEAGVAANDLTVGQLDMSQQNSIVRTSDPEAEVWSNTNGFFGFDPLPAIWQAEGLVRIVSCGKVVSVVVASEEMLTTRREELEDFLTGFVLAWDQFRQDHARFGQLFLDEASMDAPLGVLDEVASIEPNYDAASIEALSLTLSDADILVIEEAQSFLLERGIVPADSNVRGGIDTDVLTSVLDEAAFIGLAEQIQ
ncbi:MAG: hypothetical protein QNJ44_24575 [Rhodobacter sp.]|nr:hypothetical protein [Rhodobacter sp.]